MNPDDFERVHEGVTDVEHESSLQRGQTATFERATRAMRAWHEDRVEWGDRAMRSLSLVNAGGAVAVAAFIGATKAIHAGPLLYALVLFTIGVILPLGYAVFRNAWAQFRVLDLKSDRRKLMRSEIDPANVKTQLPPTRPWIWITIMLNILSLAIFVSGFITALFGFSWV